MGMEANHVWKCDRCESTEVRKNTKEMPSKWSTIDLHIAYHGAPHSRDLCPDCTQEVMKFLKMIDEAPQPVAI